MHAGVCQRVHLLHHQRRSADFLFYTLSSVFLLLTHRLASEKCQQEKRKTVNGEDILFAMTSLGFENYSEALKIYLSRYREVSCQTRPCPRIVSFVAYILAKTFI